MCRGFVCRLMSDSGVMDDCRQQRQTLFKRNSAAGAWVLGRLSSRQVVGGHGAAVGPKIAAPMLRSLFLTHLCAQYLVSCLARAHQKKAKTSSHTLHTRSVPLM